MIPTDGGRYDVNVFERKKYAVYWEENSTDIKRCSWFYKGPLDRKFVRMRCCFDDINSILLTKTIAGALRRGIG